MIEFDGIFHNSTKKKSGDIIPKMTLTWEKWNLDHTLGAQSQILLLSNPRIPIISTTSGQQKIIKLDWIFHNSTKNVSWGHNLKKASTWENWHLVHMLGAQAQFYC